MFGQEEKVRDAVTINEMRAEINRLSNHNSIVRVTATQAMQQGLSGEDRYVLLAYHTLKLLGQMKALVLEDLYTRVCPPMVMVVPPPKGE